MPIRFHCANCHQRLSVSTSKRGQQVKCPRCRRIVLVPQGDEPAADELQPVTAFPAIDAPTETRMMEVAYPVAEQPQSAVTSVTLPRYVLFIQGFLLGAVALVFFVFGLMVGSRSTARHAVPAAEPVVVSGTVTCEVQGTPTADVASVVLLLPASKRPDERAAAEGLSPSDPPPADNHPSLMVIRGLGGDYARVDQQGRYQVRAASTGRYYLVIISRKTTRGDGEHPQASELAQLGRYLRPPTQLLGHQAYRWKELLLRSDTRLDVLF